MLNIWARTLLRCQPLKNTYRILAVQSYATFSARDILHETSDEAGTLLTRFSKHVALERQKICEQVPTKVKYSDYFPISDIKYFQRELQKTDKEQIAPVITYAFTYRSNADPAKFAIILNELDRHAVNNVNEMNMDTILRTLYAFMFLMPNWMTRLDFYSRAMHRLYEEYNKQETKLKEHFLQLCFYMGLSKKQTANNVNELLNSLLEKCLDQHINELNTLDLAIVSNAAYKTSTVIKSEEFNQRILKEVLDISNRLDGNDALLVTFIKSMRLQRFRSSEVCEYIENICQDRQKLQQLQLRGQVHLFAYLAENMWDSKQCTQNLIESISEQLKLLRDNSSRYSENIRGKDISTYLWASAQLNCSMSSVQLLTVEDILLKKFDSGEFNNFADQLVDSCLSLWILGYRSQQLLQCSMKLKSTAVGKRHQPKVDSRLVVLMSAAKIEEPTCSNMLKGFEAFDLKAKLPPYLLQNQDIPYNKIVNDLVKEDNVVSANLSCPINGINIPGIHVILSSGSEIFLEILTPEKTLHFSQEPFGILRLKMRLMQALGHKTKSVSLSHILNTENLNAVIDSCVQDVHADEPSKTSIKA